MQDRSIEKLVEQTIDSFDGTKRAEAKPFLLTRIFARMQNRSPQNIWTKAGSLLSTPRVALAGLLVIILINATIIMQYMGSGSNTAQNTATVKDEFAINMISIYDIENQEP